MERGGVGERGLPAHPPVEVAQVAHALRPGHPPEEEVPNAARVAVPIVVI